MKLRIVVLASSILCSSLAYAQDQQTESLKHLPQEIRLFLDQKYPGWKFAPVSELAMECNDVETQSHPSLTWGDFNGDGKTDFAVQIIQNGRISAYQLLSHGKKFVVNVLFKNVLIKQAHVGHPVGGVDCHGAMSHGRYDP